MACLHAAYVSGLTWGRLGGFWPKQVIVMPLEASRRDVNIEGLTIARVRRRDCMEALGIEGGSEFRLN